MSDEEDSEDEPVTDAPVEVEDDDDVDTIGFLRTVYTLEDSEEDDDSVQGWNEESGEVQSVLRELTEQCDSD